MKESKRISPDSSRFTSESLPEAVQDTPFPPSPFPLPPIPHSPLPKITHEGNRQTQRPCPKIGKQFHLERSHGHHPYSPRLFFSA